MIPKDLQELRKLYLGFTGARVIITANHLGLFDYLREPYSAQEIAKTLKTELRATEILLDALAGIGLVKKDRAKQYRNTSLSNRYLIKSARLYQGDIIRHASSMWNNFSALDTVIRTGKPARRGPRDRQQHEAFILGMHNLSLLRAEALMRAIGLKGVRRMLDLGGGPGTNAIAMTRKGVHATVFDLPETIAISKKVARKEKATNLSFISGDFQHDSIGSGYDLILVSQIFHAYSASENLLLLSKCRKALHQGGRVAVQEFPINESRTAPPHSALFSVNMLVGTEQGRCYSPGEIKQWLEKAGFESTSVKRLEETVLILGKNKN